jgi:hypothetical protein
MANFGISGQAALPPVGDVRAWLITIFYSIVSPVPRGADLLMIEARPLTLSMFFETCLYLIEHRGVPRHVVAGVVEVRMAVTMITMIA